MKSNKEYYSEILELLKDKDFREISLEQFLAVIVTILFYANVIFCIISFFI